jgi:hypothetical protein
MESDLNNLPLERYHGIGDDGDRAFEEITQAESLIKQRTLKRISNMNRERSASNLNQDLDDMEEDAEEEPFIHLPDVRKELFEAIPEPYFESAEFRRVIVTNLKDGAGDSDSKEACKLLQKCMKIREKWISMHPFPPQDIADSFLDISHHPKSLDVSHHPKTITDEESRDTFRRRSVVPYEIFDEPVPKGTVDLEYKMIRGVVMVRRSNEVASPTQIKKSPNKNDFFISSTDEFDPVLEDVQKYSSFHLDRSDAPAKPMDSMKEWKTTLFPVQSFDEYIQDFFTVRRTIFSGPVSSYAFNRLEFLSAKFNLHCLLNASMELEAQKSVPHRDFYNVRKVDTHVHHSACMNQKHLLRFIKAKLKQAPTEAVIFRDGRFLTLGEVFKSLNLTAYDLSIDTLDMHANNTFHRFDKFNLKYNPAGETFKVS